MGYLSSAWMDDGRELAALLSDRYGVDSGSVATRRPGLSSAKQGVFNDGLISTFRTKILETRDKAQRAPAPKLQTAPPLLINPRPLMETM